MGLSDMRELVLICSPGSCASADGDPHVADTQLRLAVETEVVCVPPHRIGSKTEAELKLIVADMAERGWILVEDTRMGAAGGQLAFQRAEPLDPAVIAAHSIAR